MIQPAKSMRYRLGPYLIYSDNVDSDNVDSDNRIILHGDAVVRMPPKSVDLLLCLLDHNGGIAAKERLIARLWPDTVVQESSLAQAILKLRRSLKEGFGDGEIIQTISKRGYRLTVAVAVAVTVEATVSRQRTADEPAVLSQLSAVDNTANEALQMDRSAARNCRLIMMAGLVVAGVALALALALPWFR